MMQAMSVTRVAIPGLPDRRDNCMAAASQTGQLPPLDAAVRTAVHRLQSQYAQAQYPDATGKPT